MPDWWDFVDAEKLGLYMRAAGKSAGEKIEALIVKMKASGMSDAAIVNVMTNDLETGGPIFFAVVNSFTKSTGFSLDFITQAGITGGVDEKTLFTWLTTSGDPCPECEPRHTKSKTYPAWEAIGLPGSGFSRCGDFCKCLIIEKEFVPEDFGEPVEIPPLSEVRKDFQERIKKDPELRDRINRYRVLV